jgi:hypothetical protein
MASVTTWTRLEPNPRQAVTAETLRARIYDPLWLLTRQWQLGEFLGEDNGSPVAVSLRGESTQLTRFVPGPPPPAPAQGERFDADALPLEALVERERATPRAGVSERLEFAAEAGQHFLRILATESFGTRYQAAFVEKFPLPELTAEETAVAGRDSVRFLRLMSGRVPDGAALAAALRQPQLPASLGILPGDESAVRKVGDAFLRWYDQLFSEPPGDAQQNPSWSSRRMEYSFTVAAPAPGPSFTGTEESVLVAREYNGGELEWYEFDVKPGASLGASADRVPGHNPLSVARTLIPSPVTFRGMPAPRWWEFEDAAVDFGAVEPDPEDLARMLLLEFAVSYGNDWFVVPVDLPVGSICRIHSLVVTDTFGVRLSIPPIAASTHPAAASWRMFRQSVDRAGSSTPDSTVKPPEIFFLAPTLMRTMEGKPLEEVLLLRDETANLAWGVERVVEGLSGRAVDRRQLYVERQNSERPPVPDGLPEDKLIWRLATEVPDYWIPLIPVRIESGNGSIAFRRGATLRQDGSREMQSARSRVLMPDPQDTLDIFEEEIPREGVRVTSAHQYARWLNGVPLLWIGRRKQPGRGEGSSGLRFDMMENGKNLNPGRPL